MQKKQLIYFVIHLFYSITHYSPTDRQAEERERTLNTGYESNYMKSRNEYTAYTYLLIFLSYLPFDIHSKIDRERDKRILKNTSPEISELSAATPYQLTRMRNNEQIYSVVFCHISSHVTIKIYAQVCKFKV